MKNLQCFFVLVLVLVVTSFSFISCTETKGNFNLAFDNPEFSVFKADAHNICGEIPIGMSMKVNGKDAEIYRKFKIKVPLKPSPSFTPVELVVRDEDGEELGLHSLIIQNDRTQVVKIGVGDDRIEVDGSLWDVGVPSQIFGGSMMVPIERICKAFDVSCEWLEEGKVFALGNDRTYELTVGERIVKQGTRTIELVTAPVLVNGMLMVSIRTTGEVLGAEVTWNGDTKVTTIKKQVYGNRPSTRRGNGYISDKEVLTLDDPYISAVDASSCIIEGQIPLGAAITANGIDAEIFHKFRHIVEVDDAPSFTPAKIEVFDEDDKLVMTKNVEIENMSERVIKFWVDKSEMEVDGELKPLKEPARLIMGGLFIPGKVVADVIPDVSMVWDAAAQKITYNTDETSLELTIDDDKAVYNGEEVILVSGPEFVRETVMIPFRLAAEAFGADVKWYAANKMVVIKKRIHPERNK